MGMGANEDGIFAQQWTGQNRLDLGMWWAAYPPSDLRGGNEYAYIWYAYAHNSIQLDMLFYSYALLFSEHIYLYPLYLITIAQ